jgi:formylglycine-generating enzyme required for sulfatase activity
VSGFRLDKYEVTVGRFRQFVNAWRAGWRPLPGSGKHTHLNGGLGLVNGANYAGIPYELGWVPSDDANLAPTDANLAIGTWTPTAPTPPDDAADPPVNGENLPMTGMNWYEAYAFCIWDEAFLPSEAEWELAAAGGPQQRDYPWGSAMPGTVNQYAIYDCNYPSPPADPDAGGCAGSLSNIAPVGTPTMGAGVWDQLDLAGNAAETTLDFDTYDFGPYVLRCTDCASLTFVRFFGARAVRGGAFNDPLFALSAGSDLAYNRDPPFGGPSDRFTKVGFRCARPPEWPAGDGGAGWTGDDSGYDAATADAEVDSSIADAGPDATGFDATLDAAPEYPDAPRPDGDCDLGPACSANLVANAATDQARTNVCTQTELAVYERDPTGACLNCAFQSTCLDDALGDNNHECEDVGSGGILHGDEGTCLATLVCGLGLPGTGCAAPGTAPAQGGVLNAYCGTASMNDCISPTPGPDGPCLVEETAGFPGLSTSLSIATHFTDASYASGAANRIMTCLRSNCAAPCGL